MGISPRTVEMHVARVLATLQCSSRAEAVHKACELDDIAQLDTDVLDPALLPYLIGWRNFCRDHDTHWVGIEKQTWRESFDRISNGSPGIETLLASISITGAY